MLNLAIFAGGFPLLLSTVEDLRSANIEGNLDDKLPNPKFGPCNLALRFLKYLVYAASGGCVIELGLIGLLIHNLDVSQGNQRVCRVAAATTQGT